MIEGSSSGHQSGQELIAFKHLMIYPLENQEFSVSFEDFAELVSDWPGMYFEMDGSFVWVPPLPQSAPNRESHSPALRQQIDGMVYDRGGRIEYLDLKGTANLQAWERITTALCEPKLFRTYDVQNGKYWASISECLLTAS